MERNWKKSNKIGNSFILLDGSDYLQFNFWNYFFKYLKLGIWSQIVHKVLQLLWILQVAYCDHFDAESITDVAKVQSVDCMRPSNLFLRPLDLLSFWKMLHKLNFPPFTFRKGTKNRVWIVKKNRRYVIKFGEKCGSSCNFLLKFGLPTKKSGHPWYIRSH